MIYYAIYTTATGAIQKVVGISDIENIGLVAINTGVGEDALEIPAPEVTDPPTPQDPPTAALYWVDVDEVVLRPELSTLVDWDVTAIDADGVEEATIGPGLPATALVNIVPNEAAAVAGVTPSTTFEVADGTFSFSTPIAGTYTINISNVFPYLDYTTEITAS